MAEEKKKSKTEIVPHEDPPSLLEWLFAGLGIALVLGAIGFLVYRGATKGDTPPAVRIEVESIAPAGDRYLVKVRVSNTGDTTAADLTIEGELKSGDKVEETSDLTLTYVPAQSLRRAGLFFTKNPHDFQLQIHAKGYEQP